MDFSRLSSFFIVLVEPKHPGNIGAVARAMGNMGFTELRIADDRGHNLHQHDEAIARACNSSDILANAKVYPNLPDALADSVYVVGTSARKREGPTPLPPRQIAEDLAGRSFHGKVALVFGREDEGLTIEEVSRCHALIKIQTNPERSSLNLSHAVQLITYEMMLALANPKPAGVPSPADQGTRDALFAHADRTLRAIGAFPPGLMSRKLRYFRQVLDRAQPTKDEIHFLHGMFRQMEWIVSRWLKGEPVPKTFSGALPESLGAISLPDSDEKE